MSVKFGIQLALDKDGEFVAAENCSRIRGPFSCVICKEPLVLRAGKKTKHHFIHGTKSPCHGNTEEHRILAATLGPLVPRLEDGPGEVKEITSDIIEEALDFVQKEILKEEKCTNCKKNGSGFTRMFTDDTRKMYGLNDLFVCPSCLVECPHCGSPNSKKRDRRYNMCLRCEFIRCEWQEAARDALEVMGTIPDSPKWLTGTRKEFVASLILRKARARVICRFMESNKDRVAEYARLVRVRSRERALAKALRSARKETEKTRERNQKNRDRKMGSQATERYNSMFQNKRERCYCGSVNKRRFMIKYTSILGSVRFCCRGCSLECKGCSKPSTKMDTERFGNCFDCYSWSSDRTDVWKKDHKKVLRSCLDGDYSAMATLYTKSPTVMKGKYCGDLLVHVPSSELDGIVRRDHLEYQDIVEVIKACRKM